MRMGRHSTSKSIAFVGSWVVAFAVGAAVAGGTGVAAADTADTGRTSTSAASAESRTGADRADDKPSRLRPRSARTALAEPSSQAAPSPDDDVATQYGDIGKWMLKVNNQIANWGGKRYAGKTLLESVNVIIVDPKSTSRTQAARGLNNAMLRSRFPAQPLHSFGFRGRIDDVTYGQKPKTPLLSYSNNFFLFRNDHGRFFGPDPMETDAGFVWSGAFSTEKVGFTGLLPGHVYVSSNEARDALARQLVASGQATYGGLVPLENAYNTDTVTTGDHDGFAVVLVLTGNTPLPRRDLMFEAPSGSGSASASDELSCPAGADPLLRCGQTKLPADVAVRRVSATNA